MDFFKDEESKYVFALTETDGRTRCRLLGMRDIMYYNKVRADEWYNNILNIIISYPDKKLLSDAINELNILYKRMID